ncbi:MAG: hypothetical protein ACTSQ8_12140 [Candidatus Helarchaeota archaeon]
MDEEEKIGLQPGPQHLLQHEFSVIPFLDYLLARPFDLMYEDRTLQQFQATIIGDLISIRNEIRENWVDNRVEEGINQIITKAREIAVEHGFTQSIQKQSRKLLIPLMVGLFAISFVIIFFVGGWPMYVIYAGLLVAICIIPRLINKRLLERWQLFADEQGSTIKKYISGASERIKNFIQFLINDVRRIFKENKMDLTNYPMRLFNADYDNIKTLQEHLIKGIKIYIVELLPLDDSKEASYSDEQPPSFKEDSYDDEFIGPEP